MISVNELFSGIGAQAKALERLGVSHEIVATSDLDKDAIVSYAAIHNGLTLEMIESYADYPTRQEMANYLLKLNIGYDFKKSKPFDWNKLAKAKKSLHDTIRALKKHSKINSNLVNTPKSKPIEMYYLAALISRQVGDISKVEKLPKADLWTYSYPCTDISNAGLQKGFTKDSGTRSALLWEVERLLNIAKENNELPQYLLMENVKALTQKKFMPEFQSWLRVLDNMGYKTYWQVLNAKDYTVPQNRERVFAVSFLDKRAFEFSPAVPLEIHLKDILEHNVDEKYYLSDEVTAKLLEQIESKDISNAVRSGGRASTDRHSWDLVGSD